MGSKINKKVKGWLIKAIRDYKSARVLINRELTDSACFHCQQCVEKLLKAYLISHSIKPTRTHNLIYLIDECIKIEPNFKNFREYLKPLNEYAVKVRYPDEFFIPTLREARKALEIAKQIKSFVLKKLKVKVRDLMK